MVKRKALGTQRAGHNGAKEAAVHEGSGSAA